MAPSLVAPSPVSLAVVIVAAGRGHRAGGAGGLPKQYLTIGGKAVLRWTLEVFVQRADVGAVQVVIHPDDRDLYDAAVKVASVTGGEDEGLATKLRPPVHGGATRQASVLAGLEALVPSAPDLVLIHDAARPFTTASAVDCVVAGLGAHTGVIAALAATDSLKIAGDGGTITGSVPREAVWRAQTPQGFPFGAILAAHRQAAQAGGGEFTDDAAVFQAAGGRVLLVSSGGHNMKITTAEDVAMAERLLAGEVAETRTGQGFDVHRFMVGDHVWLCGVRVMHSQALEGHSDADVGLACPDGRAARGHRRRRHRPAFPAERSTVEGCSVPSVFGRCGPARSRARWPDRQRRRDALVRGAEDRATPRCYAKPYRGDPGRFGRSGGRQGDDNRRPRFHGAAGGYCGHGHCHRADTGGLIGCMPPHLCDACRLIEIAALLSWLESRQSDPQAVV